MPDLDELKRQFSIIEREVAEDRSGSSWSAGSALRIASQALTMCRELTAEVERLRTARSNDANVLTAAIRVVHAWHHSLAAMDNAEHDLGDAVRMHPDWLEVYESDETQPVPPESSSTTSADERAASVTYWRAIADGRR